VPRPLWTDLILPVNMQEKTALLAATSPQGANNSYCSYLLNLTDNGKHVFNVINLMEVCKTCRAGKNPELCTHKSLVRSANKSAKKIRLTYLMYDAGDKGKAMEELYGQERKSKGGVIPDEFVDAFKSNVRALDHRPRAIYCSFDPGGGSSAGQFGICVAVEINTLSEGVKIVVSLCLCLFGRTS